ncbi:hypothetical protein [Paraburkholderia strydomiana]|uniref:hypothetical protein n=1 Tax=Paraburkholderia strydomiana TaxID=1245417 RepID=UPI0038BBEFED
MVFVPRSFCIDQLRIMCAILKPDLLIVVTATDPIMDRLTGLWPYFGQLAAMQVCAWLVAQPLARLLLIPLGLALAAVLLIGVS